MTIKPTDFTIQKLKELLDSRELSTAGTKIELIARLNEHDPTGRWMKVPLENETRQECEPSQGIVREEGAVGNVESSNNLDRLAGGLEHLLREVGRLAQEVENLKGEAAQSQEPERRSDIVAEQSTQMRRAHVSVKSVAELLGYFDGRSGDFPNWAQQLWVLKNTYELSDDETKILMGMRLRGKAQEWMHSRPEFIEMSVDALLVEYKKMFCFRPSKSGALRQLQERTWRKDESFVEYYHDKIIKANRVPIDDPYELVDHLVEGIPDQTLRNQAITHCFNHPEAMLRAFEKLSLPQSSQGNSYRGDRWGTNPRARTDERRQWDWRTPRRNVGNCYNCGEAGHLSRNCPAKERGLRCYRCGEHGHIASGCPQLGNEETTENANSVRQISGQQTCKSVRVSNLDVTALIDTGSDLTLVRNECYLKMGSPKLQSSGIIFRGIGSGNIKTRGSFKTDITVDGGLYPIRMHIVSDALLKYDLLIGADFLSEVNVTINKGIVQIGINKEEHTADRNIPDICRIECVENVDGIDLTHITNVALKEKVRQMVANYIPERETNAKRTYIEMHIILKDEQPVYQRARRLAPTEKKIVNKQIEEWVQKGIVQPSLSEYASPIVLVDKKDGSKRLCVDYRKLNQKIVKDRYPLPIIEEQLDALQGAKIFSTLDLKNGFFHVPISEDSRKFTSFVVPDGQYEFLRVPFGLCNSPSVFTRFINAVFRNLINQKIVLTYMDDLIIPSVDLETGVNKLTRVLATAKNAGLEINWKKCALLQSRVEFLGHIVKNGGIQPSEKKTRAVVKFPKPTTIKQVQSFLGLSGYFRKFIKGYAFISRPLSNLLRDNVKFDFGTKETAAFEQLKIKLCESPVLKLYKIEARTELHTDASMYGYGAILMQQCDDDGEMHPVYFASGKTTQAEEKYSSYELEVLAIVKGLKKFRTYLIGIDFKIVTDCKAFAQTMRKKDLCVRVARWALLLEEFNYTIEHRSGKAMTHVDALSRNPLPECLVVRQDNGITFKIRRAQQKDDETRRVFERTEEGKMSDYVVRGGLLFKVIDGDVRLVIPKKLQSQIIQQTHRNGHFAAAKTEKLLKRDYWFPAIKSKTEKIIANCVECILAERKLGKQDGFLNPICKGEVPLDTYHIDHLGPLPSTKKNYRYILLVVDAFTKFVWFYVTKSTTTREVLQRLEKQAVTFGNPRRIISDRGTAFTSSEFQEYCVKEGIQHTLIVTGVPRGNGQVERVNRTLIPLLTKLSLANPGEWYRNLESAQKYFNATPHRSINTSPFQLFFGTRMRAKNDPQVREILEEEWTASFEEERNETRERAKEAIEKIQAENKRNFNKRRKKAPNYQVDDLVAIKRTQIGSGLKLAAKFLGPYRITKVLRNDRYIVEKIGSHEGPRETSTVADQMKPWTRENQDVNSGDSDANEYETSDE